MEKRLRVCLLLLLFFICVCCVMCKILCNVLELRLEYKHYGVVGSSTLALMFYRTLKYARSCEGKKCVKVEL